MASYFPELEILDLVGRGGMGVVYRARQKRLDRLVALKILSPSVGKDPAFAERFTREALALARLNHPNIVAVYDFGQTGDLFYFLMEYVDGLSLRRLLDTGKLAPAEALAIVPQICEALQYAHDAGIIHRDIKPENILLDKQGRVKIADFGLAKLMGRTPGDMTLTGVDQVMGTPHYMAPEQMERPQAVDHRADIYSLGVVFYQMLTGELPLGRFAPPSRIVQIDVRLDEVVLRALEKEPERRYQQASEMKTEVEIVSRAPPASVPQPSTEPDVMSQPGHGSVAGPPASLRLSRTAIVGAVCAPPCIVLGVFTDYVALSWILASGTTILGLISIRQIRRSAGRLYGLGLALFDTLLFPLLILDGVIFLCWHGFLKTIVEKPVLPASIQKMIGVNYADPYENPNPILLVCLVVLTSAVVDFLIVRWAWRALSKPVTSGMLPYPEPATLVGLWCHAWRRITSGMLPYPEPATPPVSAPPVVNPTEKKPANHTAIGYIALGLVLVSFFAFLALFAIGPEFTWLNAEAAASGAFFTCIAGCVFGLIGRKTLPGGIAIGFGGAIILLTVVWLMVGKAALRRRGHAVILRRGSMMALVKASAHKMKSCDWPKTWRSMRE